MTQLPAGRFLFWTNGKSRQQNFKRARHCRGDTRPARGSKLTLFSKRFARTVDGYHPSSQATFVKTRRISFAWRCGPFNDHQSLEWAGFAAGMGPDKVWQDSPNQVLTHAARAAAKAPLVAARGAREGLWLEQWQDIIRIRHGRDNRHDLP